MVLFFFYPKKYKHHNENYIFKEDIIMSKKLIALGAGITLTLGVVATVLVFGKKSKDVALIEAIEE